METYVIAMTRIQDGKVVYKHYLAGLSKGTELPVQFHGVAQKHNAIEFATMEQAATLAQFINKFYKIENVVFEAVFNEKK
ncbi:MAG: hypothetical protein F9K23_15940 [Bacteroidetes bacterium]|nr:MAG: hypothetical protein F9K23_15940 [Bacteroidota bacterium]